MDRVAVLDDAAAAPAFVAGLAKVAEGIDQLLDAGFGATDANAARLAFAALEGQARRIDAARVQALDAIEAAGLHRRDGHRSAKIMCRHVGRLSGATALRLDQSATALRAMPHLAAAFATGTVSTDQVALVARAYANPRIRAHVAAMDEFFTDRALDSAVDFRSFERLVRDFVDRVDEDGTVDRHQRTHRNRDAKLTNDFDGSWHLSGGCGPNDGAQFQSIWQRFIDEQFTADWADAKERLGGDDICVAVLARTPQQRRWDALLEMARRAASTLPGESGSQVVTTIMIDAVTFERWTAAYAGGPVSADDPFRPGRRCETIDGHPVDPSAAVATALVGYVRRRIVDARGVTINLSRKSRFFRDAAALAARMGTTACSWPGCWHPVTNCQIDHMIPWGDHGDTEQDNATPCCGFHNRLRNQGYRLQRLTDGTITVHDPHGRPIA